MNHAIIKLIGVATILSILGVVGLAAAGKSIPDGLISTAIGSTIGALAGIARGGQEEKKDGDA